MVMLFPPDRVSEEVDILRRVAGGESVNHFEAVRIRKDRKPILVTATISPLRDATGVIIGASRIARDITETRRIEQAVQEHEARLTAIIGAAMDGVIIVDERQRITMFNPAAEAMFGCLASEVLAPAWTASSRHASAPNMKATFANSVIPKLPAAAWGAWARFTVCGPTEKCSPSKPPSRRPKSTARNFSL
jgi:PAS domain-containing protein